MAVPQLMFGVGVSVLALGVLGYVTYQMYLELEEREKERLAYRLSHPPPPYTKEDRDKYDREQILKRQKELEERVRSNLKRVNRGFSGSSSASEQDNNTITRNLYKMPQ